MSSHVDYEQVQPFVALESLYGFHHGRVDFAPVGLTEPNDGNSVVR